MLHIMDYGGRDNFNKMLLQAVSVLGLVTVLSGFGFCPRQCDVTEIEPVGQVINSLD